MNGEDGSIESTPTVRPASRRAFVSAPISVDLPDARRTREADDGGRAGVRVDLAHELPALGAVVLDERDRARQRAAVAGEQALGERRRRSSSAQSSQGALGSPPPQAGRALRFGPPMASSLAQTTAANRGTPPSRSPTPCVARPRRCTAARSTLLRFMRANNMLNRHYARLLARFAAG